jgi:tryptophan synthase
MGTTGSSEKSAMNTALPEIISRVKEYATVPVAVGFGVATRDHFNTVADAGADGVVIGSRLVNIIKEAPKDQIPLHVELYCRKISLKGEPPRVRSPPSKPTTPSVYADPKDPSTANVPGLTVLPMRFGQYGGQYVPEALFDCLVELEEAHKLAMADPAFWKEFESFYGYMNRPSKLYFAESLTKHAGGAKIWLKREDLYVTFSSINYWGLVI